MVLTSDQLDRCGHWLSEWLDDTAPLNEARWRQRAEIMMESPTIQSVLCEIAGH